MYFMRPARRILSLRSLMAGSSFSELQPRHLEGGAGDGATWVPPRGFRCVCKSSAARLCSLLSVPVGGYFSDGLSTGARPALAEVHAPLGGTRWLLYALVAECLFLGHCGSRSRTGADTGLPRGRLGACVWSALAGCGEHARRPWPGKCGLRPGPVMSCSGPFGQRGCPITTS